MAHALQPHALRGLGSKRGAPALTAIEDETLFCRETNKEITREQCLDFSGERENMEECNDCPYFKINRGLLE